MGNYKDAIRINGEREYVDEDRFADLIEQFMGDEAKEYFEAICRERDDAIEDCRGLEDDIADLEDKNRDLRDDLEDLQKEIDNLNCDNERLQERINDLEANG